eukprot:TRINITY_DN84149_c0_g1_i1.p1 TRINITY_DN84149_c0_g1~~TRINITY_DN84149_c0_g1_i1.p1  ORF type:complete len:592 (-),score=58.58 TRINITY_DN84149_c0_g1_i1:148-1659(-)
MDLLQHRARGLTSQRVSSQQPPSFAPPPRVSDTSKFFLWLTDAHVDLYYGTEERQCKKHGELEHPLGMVGCDPPLRLMESTVQAAYSVAASLGDVEFVLFTGDFTRHQQDLMPDPSKNVTATIEQTLHALSTHDSVGTISVGALGNDDSPQDYQLNITTNETQNPWLSDVATVFSREGCLSSSTLDKYTYGGFYEQSVGGLTVITLNTIIYSVRHIPQPPPGEMLPADPFGQLEWLRNRLQHASATGQTVWIVSHIPPGMETYGYTQLWHPEYLAAYQSILEQPELGGTVAAQLFGHTHSDEFRLMPRAPEKMGPVLIAGAISPIYRSNPTFRLVEYDPLSGRPLNWVVYYSPVPQGDGLCTWRLGYSAAQAYKPLHDGVLSAGALYHAAFEQLALELNESGPLWNIYAGWYKVQYINDLMYCGMQPQAGNETLSARQSCVSTYMCGLRVSNQGEYEECKSQANVEELSNSASDELSVLSDDYYELSRQAHLTTIGAEHGIQQ